MDRPGRPAVGVVQRLVPRSFTARIIVSTTMLMTIAMVVVVVGIQVLLAWTARRDVSTVLNQRAQAVVTVVDRASRRGLTVPHGSLDPGVEVYDGAGRLVAGSVELDARDAAADLSRSRTPSTGRGPEGDEQLLAVPFTTPSGDRAVVVVSQETAAYERAERYALLATIGLGVVVIVGTAFFARRVTHQVLTPVRQMAERAADWSEQDLSHRFGLGPPTDELAALGETLDHLLDRVASVILSEQRLTSELAHELRTPLASIQGSADLALMRGGADEPTRVDLDQISRSSREMAGVITTLLDLARDGAEGFREQTCLLAEVLPPLLADAARDGGRVRVVGDDPAGLPRSRIAAPPDLLVRAVTPVLDNAVRHARTSVTVTAVDRPDGVELTIADDGPGVDPAAAGSIFEPGRSSSGGAGLGLGIARRVARSFGGDVVLAPGAGGARFVIRLPRRSARSGS